MRLWHKDLIPYLPDNQLKGQHREICGMRGLGWGKPHSTVNYVWNHPYSWLYYYHRKVMFEMERRGWSVAPEWWSVGYRGKRLGYDPTITWHNAADYPEHDDDYLKECLDNLAAKEVVIKMRGAA